MIKKAILGSLLVCFLTWSCEPKPVHTQLAGYAIQFPITLAQLRQEYKKGFTSNQNKFIDSTQTTRAEWWFDSWGGRGNQEPTNQAYGVNLFIKNKAHQLDSIKIALERYYNQPLRPIEIRKLNVDTARSDSSLYTCHINKKTILILKKVSRFRNEPWS